MSTEGTGLLLTLLFLHDQQQSDHNPCSSTPGSINQYQLAYQL